MWSGRRILRNDPRRNFCFGITTEKAACRLWFFARSHVMVTEPFNCNMDHAPLVRFILSLSFAHVLSTPSPQFSQYTVGKGCTSARPISSSSPLTAKSNQSVNIVAEPTSGNLAADASRVYSSVNHDFALRAHGYDPTMQRLRHGVYRIRVGDRWYITAGTLSDSRAERICGRCTRVWRVYEDKKYEEGEEKVYYVLKDVWVDSSNNTEATVWRRLKEKVNAEVFDQHFLTLVAAFEPGEDVTTCSFLGRGNYPHTENVDFMDSQFIGILDLEPSPLIPEKVPDPFDEEDRFYIKGAMEPPARRARTRPRYHPRTHDRSVWKEVCETYHDQDDMQVMFTMLEHAVKALKAMWEDAHAIHRDISTGNVLFDGGNGRLGDLECVVFYDDEPSPVHSVKTGTLQFMAVEVSYDGYRFRPISIAEDVFLTVTDVLPPLDTEPVHPFRCNALHDLESIWWLAMWSILSYYPNNIGADPEALEIQRHTYEALFSPDFALDKERNNALANERPRFISSIAPPFHAVGQLAFRLRNMLRVSYTIAETTLPIRSDCQVFHSAFAATVLLLEAMKTSLEEAGITNVTRVYELLYPLKRKAEDTGGIQEEEPPMEK
ncbi:hypothetical protein BDN71DRAFT_769049 [Pleurotus eryngii]|uniref:Fungal-type protein kinase domain-containing protein n=1 Tax=Pleurotus eryngii TaxID=5323 RepID=A0A9P6D7Z3_PLEER|nr:hypothetical protein BDN71DRAFT_769049 [Pleurotus eryngii]